MTWYPGKIIGDVFRGEREEYERLRILYDEFNKEWGIGILDEVMSHIDKALDLAIEGDWSKAQHHIELAKLYYESWIRIYEPRVIEGYEDVFGDSGPIKWIEYQFKEVIATLEEAIRERDKEIREGAIYDWRKYGEGLFRDYPAFRAISFIVFKLRERKVL